MPQELTARFTHAQRKVIAELLPELADRLLLDTPNTRTLMFLADTMERIRERASGAIRHPEDGVQRNSLRHIIEATTKALENSQGIGAIPKSERLCQFKITLLDSQPSIWRRIQIKDCTLDKLHEHIQTAMGWTNSHLHQFEIDGMRHGHPELLDDGFDDFECVDSTVTRVSEIVPKDGKPFRFLYEYDFGDRWEHEVLFEGCLRAEPGGRYPVCVEGEQACPPEDVGGMIGFETFLEALADPTHEDHELYADWGAGFDAGHFDAEKATKAMRRGLPYWRQHS